MVDFIKQIFEGERRSGYVIAALLDEKHDAIVRDIWRELHEELGVAHIFKNPTPHITHIQAQDGDVELLREGLSQFALMQPPFKLRTVGLGIFTGEKPAIYVSVVRNPEISRIQTSVIGAVASGLEGISEHNFINYWMPHISLLIPGMVNEQLPQVLSLLTKRNFSWEVTVNRFVLLDGMTTANSDKEPYTVTLEGLADGG